MYTAYRHPTGVCVILSVNYLWSHAQLSEIEILEKIEKMTDPVAEEGEWITRTDLVQRGSALILEEQPTLGVCGAACKTIARAAEEILGEHDTDLGEVLWKVRRLPQSKFRVTDWCWPA
jgi:hypothetical protein